MDYSQFMKLMDPGGNLGKDSLQSLQEYISEFPYFQTAHALLAQTMNEQQHVRFEKQLKVAAAYAGDRNSLYNLIHPKPSRLFSDKPSAIDSPFIVKAAEVELDKENIFLEEKSVIPPSEENKEDLVVPEYVFTPTPPLFVDELDLPEELTEADNDDGPPVADPHEIIRRRLSEILGLKENQIDVLPKPQIISTPAEKIPEEAIEETSLEKEVPVEIEVKSEAIQEEKTEPKVPEQKIGLLEKIMVESAKATDIVQKGELEYALEASIIQSLEKLPEIKKIEEQETVLTEPLVEQSFYQWLKLKSINGFGRVEEVHADDEVSLKVETEEIQSVPETKSSASKDMNVLIDRFIKSEPKIIPSKVEFYSPSNQAKKSITEDEDLVSETLANIYRQQGNLLKARSSYQKLSLLIPEKMAYFAALISTIDKELNNQDKQDL
jgi:hypothetical protein